MFITNTLAIILKNGLKIYWVLKTINIIVGGVISLAAAET